MLTFTISKIGTILLRVSASLAFFLVLFMNVEVFAQEDKHWVNKQSGTRFPVGMFSVLPFVCTDTDTMSADTLAKIWKGNSGGYEAVNILHAYGTWWSECDGNKAEKWIDLLLNPVAQFNDDNPGANLKVIIGTLYGMFVDADTSAAIRAVGDETKPWAWRNHVLDSTSLSTFVDSIDAWDSQQDTGVVAGWYAFDEPNEQGYDLAEYYKLIDVLRNEDSQDLPIYGDVSPNVVVGTGNMIDPSDSNGYRHISQHWINWNGDTLQADDPADENKLIDATRFPSSDGRYKDRWYFTMWECDVLMIDDYNDEFIRPGAYMVDYYEQDSNNQDDPSNLSGWIGYVLAARGDFDDYGDNRSWSGDWKLHAVLAGQEGYNQAPDAFPSHSDYHNVIEHVRDLRIDGIWFWAWSPDSADIRKNWLDNRDWAEAVENEIEGTDKFISAKADNNFDHVSIDRYEYVADGLGDSNAGWEEVHNESSIVYHVSAMTAGDYDGDGDDELIVARTDTSYDDAQIFMYETGDSSSLNGGWGEDIEDSSSYWHTTAMASGDFNGDGNDELIVARTDNNFDHTRIDRYEYVADGLGAANSGWVSIYNDTSNSFHVTAMTAGDYDGDGDDELIIARMKTNNDSSQIFINADPTEDDGWGSSLETPGSYWHTTSLTSGDFDGDGNDELIIAKTDNNFDHTRIDRYEYVADGLSAPNAGWQSIYNESSNSYHIISMTAGDYDGDGDAELIIGRSTTDYDDAQIFMFEDGTADTTNSDWGIDLEDSSSYWHTTAMTSGDFNSSQETSTQFNRLAARSRSKSRSPNEFTLFQNYPNPFNPSTTISFQLPNESRVIVRIYDLLGREVAELINKKLRSGHHIVNWDGRNDSGARSSSGLYFYKVTSGGKSFTSKMLLLK